MLQFYQRWLEFSFSVLSVVSLINNIIKRLVSVSFKKLLQGIYFPTYDMYRDSAIGSDRNSTFLVKYLFSGSLSPSNVRLRILFVFDEWIFQGQEITQKLCQNWTVFLVQLIQNCYLLLSWNESKIWKFVDLLFRCLYKEPSSQLSCDKTFVRQNSPPDIRQTTFWTAQFKVFSKSSKWCRLN